MRIVTFVLLTLFMANLNFAQRHFSLNQIPSESYYDHTSNSIYFISNDTFYSFNGKGKEFVKKLKSNADLSTSKLIVKNKTPYFINSLGGEIYRQEFDSIVRIDKSFLHKNQISSSIFLYQDTIYKFGGYGFFTAKDFFTYFSNTSHEWEVLVENESTTRPLGLFDAKSFMINEEFYIFGGYTIDHLNRNKSIANHTFWKFSFKELKWKLLGNINLINMSTDIFDFTQGDDFYFYDKGDLLQLNTKSLKITRFINNDQLKYVILSFPGLAKDDKIYALFHDESSHDNPYTIKQIDLSKFTTREIIEINTANEVLPKYYLFLGLFTLAISVLMYVKSKSTRRLKLKKDKLYFNFKNVALTMDEKQLMTILMNKKRVENNKLLTIYPSQFADSHKSKLKNETIQRLNDKLDFVSNGMYQIVKKPDLMDKRFYVYSLQKKES